MTTYSEAHEARRGLRGRTALVTGAARGIGLRVAQRLAEEGCPVVLADVSAEKLREAGDQFRKAGQPVLEVLCDVHNPTDIVGAFDKAENEFGTVELLVNNAGISRHAPPETYLTEDWDAVMAIDLRAPFLFSRELAKRLGDRQASIVNLSSIAGSTSLGRGIFSYGVAKAGIEQLTRELAVEWATFGIRVNAVAPCQVETEGFRFVTQVVAGSVSNLESRALEGIPLGRLATTDDIASAIIFLLGNEAAMITGSTLAVDGGNLALNPGGSLRVARA